MPNEEWMEFLKQSIASHDQQLGELAESQARTDRQIATTDREIGEMRAAMAERDLRMDAMIANTQLNFDRLALSIDRLALAMAGLAEHATDHARRIGNLEGRHA